ncbi:MAG TPA: hypothetical protein VNW99_01855 [Cytophagaceae bacterium]|jgi:hypothetical protein|nr:hypothetical protein [Cytophagaceae bacterium]
MRKLLYILTSIVLFFFAAIGNAYAASDEFTHERYAFAATWVIFGALFLTVYLVWKKRKSKITMSQHAAKFRTKTYEIMSHGKRMVITKKINIEPTKK